jgi:DNA-binding NtrC family response regulator
MKKKILIADSDKSTRDSLTDLLDACGYVTVTAETPRQAVRLSLLYPVDLVLLEIPPHSTEGFEALEWFGRLHPFLPVVILTSEKYPYKHADAPAADALLEKPVNANALLHTVHLLLAESHHDRLERTSDPGSQPISVPEGKSPAARLLTRN